MMAQRNGWLRTVLCCCVLGLLGGCAYRQHLERGDTHHQAGRYEEALTEYEEARRADPEEAEVHAKIADTRRRLLAQWTQQTQQALGGQDLPTAIELAGKLHTVLGTEPSVGPLVAQVTEQALVASDAYQQAGDFPGALRLLDALASRVPSAAGPAGERSTRVREAWAATLDQAALAAEQSNQRFRALLLRTKAWQLAPTPARQARRTALRSGAFEELTYWIAPDPAVRTPGTAEVLAELGDWQPTLIRVAAPGITPPRALTRLSLSLTPPHFEDRRSTRTAQVNFQSGTRAVPNPTYQHRQDEVTRAEREVLRRQEEVDRQQRYVEQYQADVAREGPTPNVSTGAEQNLYNARNRLDAARQGLEADRRQLQRVTEELRTIPPFVEEPVYSVLQYTVNQVTRSGRIDLEARLRAPDSRPTQHLRETFRVEVRDEEHPAQPAAGLPADPLRLPDPATMTPQLYQQAAAYLRTALYSGFQQYRALVLAEAHRQPDAARQLDGLIRFVLLDPATVQPGILAELRQLSALPDAPELLALP